MLGDESFDQAVHFTFQVRDGDIGSRAVQVVNVPELNTVSPGGKLGFK